LAPIAESRDRGPVGGCADGDLVDVFGVDIGVLTETDAECTGECVDEKVKNLILIDFTEAYQL
jgi:hypothetical protein